MKTLITILAVTAALSSPALASTAKHHIVHRPVAAADYYAVSPSPWRDDRAADGCIGLSSGTSDASCGATLTGGPVGGLN